MIPTAEITILPPTVADPTKKRVRVLVSPAGSYLVRGAFADTADITEESVLGPDSPGASFIKTTGVDGSLTIEVEHAVASAFFFSVAVLGVVGVNGMLAAAKLFLGSSDSIITTDGELAAWVTALGASAITDYPVEGGAYALAVAPPPNITNLVIAYPSTMRVLSSVIQVGSGMEVKQSWIDQPDSTTLTYEEREYRVYQNVTLFPWTAPDTFTVTI